MILAKEVDLEALNGEDAVDASKRGLPFRLRDGLLYHNGVDGYSRLCIPFSMIDDMLKMAHDDQHHFGIERMTRELSGLSIRNLSTRIRKHIHGCETCCLGQTDRQRRIGNYQPVRAPLLPMHTIAVDFITEMPPVSSKDSPWALEGFDTFDQLMTVTCAASKRNLLIPGYCRYTAADWATVLARQLMLSDWGMPKVIISDRDSKFTSPFWRGLWKSFGTRLAMTAAYHPSADGLAERRNQTVEIALRFHNMEHPGDNWTYLLPALQWNLNGAYNTGTKTSAHEFIYGFSLRGPLESFQPDDDVPDLVFMREAVRKDAQLAMDFAAAKAKRWYDAKHRPIQLKAGDRVYLRLHDGYYLPGRPPRKWSQQRSGPYKILEMVGDLACRLDLPNTMKIHPVISCRHLQPAHADDFQPEEPGPLEEDEEVGDQYEVERLLFKQVRRLGRAATPFEGFMVRWKGWGPQHDSWVRSENIDPQLVRDFKAQHPSDDEEDEDAPFRRAKPRRSRSRGPR